MRVRVLLVVIGVVGITGCRSPAPDAGAQAGSGRVELGSEHGALLSGPADAAWCSRDGAVAMVAAAGDWVAAIAFRTAQWPLDSAATFVVDSVLGATGSAALALRSMRDSVHAAYLGRSGSLRLLAASDLAGDVDVRAVTAGGDSLRIRGSLRAVAVRGDGCPPPPDTVVLR